MTYKNAMVITSTIFTFLLTALMAPTVNAVCDLTSVSPALTCLEKGKKCNIKFKNVTGLGSGAGGATGYNQEGYASTVKISARKEDKTRAGSNSISIAAGQDKTFNLDKKKDFEYIKVQRNTGLGVKVAKINCEEIQTILSGKAHCKVFVGYHILGFRGSGHGEQHTVVKCDGGSVVVPPESPNS